jgi:hypothetical protein
MAKDVCMLESILLDRSPDLRPRYSYSSSRKELAGSMWALLRNPFDRAQLTHLGLVSLAIPANSGREAA